MAKRIATCFFLPTLLLGGYASAASSWVSADSYTDSSGKWQYESRAYDGNDSTYADDFSWKTGYGAWLELHYSSAVYSDRLRVNADFGYGLVDKVGISVKYSGDQDYTEVHDGVIGDCTFTTVTFTPGSVVSVRFRFHYTTAYRFWLYELQLYRLVTPVDPAGITRDATSVNTTTAVMHGKLTDDGGVPTDLRFQYGATTSYGTDTAWGGQLQSGDSVGLRLYGLSDATTYHYRAQFKNATNNIISGEDQTFTTGAPASSEIWISPTGVTDPDSGWENENNAIDDEAASYAKFHRAPSSEAWSKYLHFQAPAGTYNGVRVMGRTDNLYIDKVDVDIYRNDAWENLYEGAVDDANFLNLPFADGTVSEARVRFHITTPAWGGYLYVYEFDFHRNGILETLTETSSVTSPAWVEGTVWYGTYTVNATVDSSSATVTKLSGQDWFVTNTTGGNPLGVTLSGTASTAVQVQAYDGASLMATENISLTWTPTDLTGKSSSIDTVTIRQGDSLLLTGTGSGTAMTIDANGDATADYTGAPADKYAYQYTTAGTYTAEAKIDGNSIGTITVVVVDVTVPTSDINGIRYIKRVKEFAVTPATAKSEVVFRGDDFQKLRIDTETETTGGIMVTYVPGATGYSHLNARLGGKNGPIISRATTNSTYYNFTGMTYEPILKQFSDGDVLTGQTITLGSALPNMKIKFVMGTGGVTYESTGTNTMYAESGDFDANAQFNYYLVTPPSNNNCHTLDSVTDEE